jgi:hypothetical protein
MRAPLPHPDLPIPIPTAAARTTPKPAKTGKNRQKPAKPTEQPLPGRPKAAKTGHGSAPQLPSPGGGGAGRGPSGQQTQHLDHSPSPSELDGEGWPKAGVRQSGQNRPKPATHYPALSVPIRSIRVHPCQNQSRSIGESPIGNPTHAIRAEAPTRPPKPAARPARLLHNLRGRAGASACPCFVPGEKSHVRRPPPARAHRRLRSH